MKLGKIFVVAIFALLVMGIIFVTAADNQVSIANPEYSEDVFTVQPMATGCSRVCSYCLPLGHGGACKTTGACC